MRKNFQSVEAIRKRHTFQRDIGMIPAADWMTTEQMKDLEKSYEEAVKSLEVVDKDLEVLLGELKDENLQLAFGRAYYVDRLSSARELKVPMGLPFGRVQVQIDLIDSLMKIAKGETPHTEDASKEIGEIRLQAEWDANPKIDVVSIDDATTELRLRNSLGIFLGYLKASEHEFYKQWLTPKLGNILHEYEMLRQTDKTIWGKEEDPSLSLTWSDFMFNDAVGKAIYVLSTVYYNRAMSYLTEVRDFWEVLHGSEFSRKYLIEFDEIIELAKARR